MIVIKIFGFVINDKILYTVLAIAIGYVIYKVLAVIINKSFEFKIKNDRINSRRERTMRVIIDNFLKYTFGTIVVFAVLGVLGVNAGAIIASIGVVGLAVGLAIQDTLRDIIVGIFILVDNQYAVGDVVSIGGFEGEVIFLGLKSTKIQSKTGETRIIANRNISEITNYSLQPAVLYIDVELAYDNDEKLIKETFESLVTKLSKDIKNIKGPFRYEGIQSFGTRIVYRLSVESNIKYQDEIKRDALSIIKNIFDEKKIRR